MGVQTTVGKTIPIFEIVMVPLIFCLAISAGLHTSVVGLGTLLGGLL